MSLSRSERDSCRGPLTRKRLDQKLSRLYQKPFRLYQKPFRLDYKPSDPVEKASGPDCPTPDKYSSACTPVFFPPDPGLRQSVLLLPVSSPIDSCVRLVATGSPAKMDVRYILCIRTGTGTGMGRSSDQTGVGECDSAANTSVGVSASSSYLSVWPGLGIGKCSE